ncbi:hypothetical protein ACIRD4_30740 [Streptomyces clavifer]|uniref:hypothetical protein n=1 Tax=Streptomyces clavifer TaxID=68188 RepID=UPI003812B3E1
MVTAFGAVTQRRLACPLSKRSVKSSTWVLIRDGALRKFCNPPRSGQQIHVPQVVAVHVWILGEALGVGAYQCDHHGPILTLFRRPRSLQA